MNDFDAAVRLFRAVPSADALRVVNAVGMAVLTNRSGCSCTAERPFLPVRIGAADASTLPIDFTLFQELRATFDRCLTDDELSRAGGAIGYALRIYLAGEDLGEPVVTSAPDAPTVAVYAYDATKSRRTEPDAAEAFRVAAAYVAEGSPVRQTNRAGAGTKGTRLVEGIGPVAIAFAVR